jgi:arabinofuranosyltransferase
VSDRAALRRRALLALALVLILTTILRSAWVCDDAYITFRVVDNFWEGHGLRWNVGERVWVFSNPLMMGSMLLLHPLSGEFFYTSIALGTLLSLLAAALVLTRLARGLGMVAIAGGLLAVSKSVIDYATSGLENCFGYVLLALAYVLFFNRDPADDRNLLALSAVAGLAALNRPDGILPVLPLLVFAWWRRRTLRRVGLVVVGFLPLILWETFALLYYGSLVPNTAYAKLSTDLPVGFYLAAGLGYFKNSLLCDPLVLPTVIGALVAALWSRAARKVAAAVGLLLHLLYVLRVGGDFMSGRFLSAAMFAAVMLWCVLAAGLPARVRRALAIVAGLAIVGVGALHPLSPLRATAGYGPHVAPRLQLYTQNDGIADERAHYFETNGLLNAGKHASMPAHPDCERGRQARARAEREGRTLVWRQITVGVAGVCAGPDVHIVDLYGITDPLLAMVPARRDVEQRIGHMERAVGSRYVDALPERTRPLGDPGLTELNRVLWRVHSGPLMDRRRLADIWRLRTGGYDRLIDEEFFRYPRRRRPGP